MCSLSSICHLKLIQNGNEGFNERVPNYSKNLVHIVKYGGSNLMAAASAGNFMFIESILQIFQGNTKVSVDTICLGQPWIFWEDNHLKHTAKSAKEWLLYNAPPNNSAATRSKPNQSFGGRTQYLKNTNFEEFSKMEHRWKLLLTQQQIL